MSRFIKMMILLCICFGADNGYAQSRSEATESGATLISGVVSFSSQGGDLFTGGSSDRVNSLTVGPSAFFFTAPGLGIGGDLVLSRLSAGGSSLTSVSVGPKIGYFFDTGASTIPFLAAGTNYLLIDSGGSSNGGLRIKFGGGMVLRKNHLGVSIEADYLIDRFSIGGTTTTGNTLFFGLGFAGFLY